MTQEALIDTGSWSNFYDNHKSEKRLWELVQGVTKKFVQKLATLTEPGHLLTLSLHPDTIQLLEKSSEEEYLDLTSLGFQRVLVRREQALATILLADYRPELARKGQRPNYYWTTRGHLPTDFSAEDIARSVRARASSETVEFDGPLFGV